MRLSKFLRETKGAVAAITALFLMVAVGAMSIAIDLAHIFFVQCELQRAADAGAMAGALRLIDPTARGNGVTQSSPPDCAAALTAVTQVVTANDADGAPLGIPATDIEFGNWNAATRTFVPNVACPADTSAVRVTTRKDAAANNPVNLFFFGIMPGGRNFQNLSATAIGFNNAPPFGAPPGSKVFPLAIDEKRAKDGETFKIYLNPTGQDDGAWHSYKYPNTNANDLRKFIDGSEPTPEINVGDNINVQNGVDDSVLKHVGTGDVLVPVIPDGAHTGQAQVLGFASFQITDVSSQGSDKYIEGKIVKKRVAPSTTPGGTNNYGTTNGTPKMVL